MGAPDYTSRRGPAWQGRAARRSPRGPPASAARHERVPLSGPGLGRATTMRRTPSSPAGNVARRPRHSPAAGARARCAPRSRIARASHSTAAGVGQDWCLLSRTSPGSVRRAPSGRQGDRPRGCAPGGRANRRDVEPEPRVLACRRPRGRWPFRRSRPRRPPWAVPQTRGLGLVRRAEVRDVVARNERIDDPQIGAICGCWRAIEDSAGTTAIRSTRSARRLAPAPTGPTPTAQAASMKTARNPLLGFAPRCFTRPPLARSRAPSRPGRNHSRVKIIMDARVHGSKRGDRRSSCRAFAPAGSRCRAVEDGARGGQEPRVTTISRPGGDLPARHWRRCERERAVRLEHSLGAAGFGQGRPGQAGEGSAAR